MLFPGAELLKSELSHILTISAESCEYKTATRKQQINQSYTFAQKLHIAEHNCNQYAGRLFPQMDRNFMLCLHTNVTYTPDFKEIVQFIKGFMKSKVRRQRP